MKKFFRLNDVISLFSSLSHPSSRGVQGGAWKTGRARSGKLSSTALSERVRRLHIETLEERALLSVWNVNTADDVAANAWDTTDNICSLREALASASAGDTITFDSSLAGQTISLTNGQLTISKTLTIDASALYDDANDAPGITISGNNASRVFTINAGTVSMIGLTITDGLLASPANATYYGAGIYNAGATLTLTDCTITNNHYSGSVLGGGISNNTGTLTINNCIVSGNTATSGGGIYNNAGTLTINDCTVTGNTSNTIGGGISNVSGGKMTLSNCAVTENLGNTNGGGIYNSAGTLTLIDCAVIGNSASNGGGIYNYTTSTRMFAMNCTIAGNTAAYGGGLYNYGLINVNNSIIVENSATTSDADVYKRIDNLNAYNTLSSFTDWTNATTEGVTNYEYDSTLPLFTDATNGDYTLARNSSAFNKGLNSSISLTTDLAGNPRIRNGIVDLGAYEFQFAVDAPVLTFDSKTDTEISISWGAVENATSYAVEYKESSASDWTPAETVSAETACYTVTGLTQTVSYDFRVRAIGDAVYQDSEWSETLSVTTKTKLATPVITKFENQDVGQDTTGTIPSLTVNWETITGAAGYKIEYQTDGAAVWQSATAADSDSSYTLHDPVTEVKYNFRVTAMATYETTVSADYVDSSPSEIKSVVKLATPSLPTFSNTTNSIRVDWENNTGLKYRVQYINRADGNLIWATADPLTDDDTGKYYYEFDQLDEGTEFDVQIQAYNSDPINIQSDWTDSVPVNSLKKLEIGDVTVASRTDEEFTLTWGAITGAARCSIVVKYYDQEYQSVPADQISGPEKQADDTWSVTVSGLNAGTTYAYSIVATPETGSNVYFSSDEKTGNVTTKTPLATPENFAVTYYDEDEVTVTWNKVANTANYQVSYDPGVGDVDQPISVEQPTDVSETTVSYNFEINSEKTTKFSVYAAPLSYSEYVNSETATYSVYKLLSPTVELYDKTSTSFTLRWKPVTNADSYSLKVKGINDPLTPTGDDGEYLYLNVTDLAPVTSYEWTLTVNPIADTAEMDYVKALYGSSTTTKSGVLQAPTNLVVTNVTSTTTQVNVGWNEVVHNNGYQYRWKDASSDLWSDWTYASDEEVSIPAANDEAEIIPGTAYDFEVKSDVTENYDESPTTSIAFQLLETPAVTVSEVTTSSFKLTWDAITNAKTTSDGYTVSVVPDTGTGVPLISTPVYTEGIGWSVDVTGLACTTAYTWSLTANPIAATSEMIYVASNAAAGTVTSKTPLTAPILSLGGKTDTEAAFSWNVDANASSYTLEYKLATDTEWKPAESTWTYSTADSRTTCTAVGLSQTTAYDFRVRANGDESYETTQWSETLSVTTKTKLAAPVLSFDGKTDTQVSFSWKAVDNAASYAVEYKLTSAAVWSTAKAAWNGIAYTVTELAQTSDYEFRVKANAAAAGEYVDSDYSETLSVTTKTKLAAPEVSASEILDRTITLTWGKVANAGTYAVQQSIDGTNWTKSNIIKDFVDETNYSVLISCDANTGYKFRVMSVSENAEFVDSDYSGVLEITSLATDTFALGTVTLAAAHGTYSTPTLVGGRTITVTAGQWRVSGSADPYYSGGTIILNGAGASFTDGSGATTAYNGEAVAVNFDGYGDTTTYALALSDDFIASVPLNLAKNTLGDLFANNFTAPKSATVTFYLDGVDVTNVNFTARWSAAKNGYVVSYVNTDITAGDHVLTVAVDYNDGTDTAEFASTQLAFIVTPIAVINGMTISGVGGRDWVWNDSTYTLTILTEEVVLTGEAIENMTILVNEGASVFDGKLRYLGLSSDSDPGELTLTVDGDDHPSLADGVQTHGALFNGSLYTIAVGSTYVDAAGNSFTSISVEGDPEVDYPDIFYTQDAVASFMIQSNGEYCFKRGRLLVDMADGNLLPIKYITNGWGEYQLVSFAEGDSASYKGITYTFEQDGGFWSVTGEDVYPPTRGVRLASTADKLTGIVFTSTSETALATMSDDSTCTVFVGDWTATRVGTDEIGDATLVLSGDYRTTRWFAGNSLTDGTTTVVTNYYPDWYFYSYDAVAVSFDSDAKIDEVTTKYNIVSHLFSVTSDDKTIVAVDVPIFGTKTFFDTIYITAGDWYVESPLYWVSEYAAYVVMTGDATLTTSDDTSTVYRLVEGADSTVCVVEDKGTIPHTTAAVTYQQDNYVIGDVTISANSGTYTAPTRLNDTLGLTDGTWTVTDYLNDATGGSVLLNGEGVTFTDAKQTTVTGSTTPVVLYFDGFGVIDYDRTLVVTTAEDVVDYYDGVTSLREAISFAGANTAWGNTITFSDAIDWTDAANTITLSATYGGLLIDRTLTIDAGTLGVTIDGNGVGSVFAVTKDAGTSELPVTLIGLTITGGTGYDYYAPKLGKTVKVGGAIANNGVAFIMDCTLTGNTADYGGAIANGKYLAMADSTVVGNTAAQYGGAIYNFAGNLVLSNVTIAGNSAENGGGGIYQNAGSLLLVNSIAVGNTLGDSALLYGADVAIAQDDSTYYANYSIIGGAYNFKKAESGLAAFNGGTSGVFGTTTEKTYADVFGTNVFDGATIKIDCDSFAASVGTLVGAIGSTIYYYNHSTNDGYWWNAATHSKSSFQFNESDAFTYGLTGGQIDTTAQNLDESGNRISRVETLKRFSVGAYSAVDTPSTVVTTFEDIVNVGDGLISLREAIAYADANAAYGNVITFSESIDWNKAENTIVLSKNYGGLMIDHTLTIDAGTRGVTIDGNGVGSVFAVTKDAGTVELPVTLIGLTITGGTGDDYYLAQKLGEMVEVGGAITNNGVLFVMDCTLTGNTADYGGAIYNLGSLTVINSTIYLNTAANDGGGVEIAGGSMSVIDSRFVANDAGGSGGALYVSAGSAASATNTIFAGNRAAADGGGIALDGALNLYNSTLSGNTALAGGGIFIVEGAASDSLNVYNSIIAQNAAETGNADFSNGSADAALAIASTLSSYDFSAFGANNLVSTTGDPLFMYALPTGDWSAAAPEWLAWRPYLTANSAAIDSGNNDYVDSTVTTDYLNKPRIVNETVDRGAIEWQTHTFQYVGEPTTLLEVADAKAGTVIASFESNEFVEVVYSVTYSTTYGDETTVELTVDAATGRLILAADAPKSVIYDSIVVTASEVDSSYSLSLAPFTLNVADKVIDLTTSGVYTVDCTGGDPDASQVIVLDGENIIYNHSLDGGIIALNGSQTAQDTFIVTFGAFDNMNSIIFNSDNDPSISCRDTLILNCIGDNNNFNVDGSENGYGAGTIELKDVSNNGALVTFNGLKNVFIDGGDGGSAGNRFAVNALDANINILNMSDVALDFTSPDGDLSNVVLNMDSQYHQSVLVGQQGTFRIADTASVTKLTLPNGRNVVSGNSDAETATVIEGGGSESHNVISLLGGENYVNVSGQSTITAEAAATENEIIVTNGTGTTVNLSKTTGENTVSIEGDKSIYYGGNGSSDTVTTDGDNCILTLTQTREAVVAHVGDSSVIQTGVGNDVIEYTGRKGSISAGDGNDTIRILGDSADNFISGEAGNDFIYAALCGGGNIFYANSGNDFIVGGSGNDTIYGNAGKNFLAGNSGRDQIFGGSGRDVLVGSMTSKLAALDETALKAVFDDLLTAWDEDDESIVDLLGDTSVSDGEADTLKRLNDGGIEMFFANSPDKDTENALATDKVYQN